MRKAEQTGEGGRTAARLKQLGRRWDVCWRADTTRSHQHFWPENDRFSMVNSMVEGKALLTGMFKHPILGGFVAGIFVEGRDPVTELTFLPSLLTKKST